MILDTTSKSIQIVLGEASAMTNCDITASYTDSTNPILVGGSNDLTSSGTTAVTVVPPPPYGVTQRFVEEIRLYNNDTIAHTVILLLNDDSTLRVMMSQVVAAGANFLYTPAYLPGIAGPMGPAGPTGPTGPTGTDGVQVAIATVTNAQCLALGTASVQIIPAAGAGTVIVPLTWYIEVVPIAGVGLVVASGGPSFWYDMLTNINLTPSPSGLNNGSYFDRPQTFGFGGTFLNPGNVIAGGIENTMISLTGNGADVFTSGDGYLTVTTTYYIMSI